MDVFSQVGSQEILVILLVAIIVIGPAKIVEFGKTIGKISRNIKQTTNEFTRSINRELEEEQQDKKKDKFPPAEE